MVKQNNAVKEKEENKQVFIYVSFLRPFGRGSLRDN